MSAAYTFMLPGVRIPQVRIPQVHVTDKLPTQFLRRGDVLVQGDTKYTVDSVVRGALNVRFPNGEVGRVPAGTYEVRQRPPADLKEISDLRPGDVVCYPSAGRSLLGHVNAVFVRDFEVRGLNEMALVSKYGDWKCIQRAHANASEVDVDVLAGAPVVKVPWLKQGELLMITDAEAWSSLRTETVNGGIRQKPEAVHVEPVVWAGPPTSVCKAESAATEEHAWQLFAVAVDEAKARGRAAVQRKLLAWPFGKRLTTTVCGFRTNQATIEFHWGPA